MSRVAWSRYAGEDIEHTVAMFLALEYPTRAVAITPSSGDGGIDAKVSLEEGWAIYQIKKFSAALTAKQKKQVRKSMDALCNDPRVKDLDVREWHLAMPWDPTLEEEKWLQEEAAERGLPEPIWHGEAWCDAHASKYPPVVDYYLHGSRETVQEMALELAAMFQKDVPQTMPRPADVLGRIDELTRAINAASPHYGYSFRIELIPAGADPAEFLARVSTQPVLHPGHVMTQAITHSGQVGVLCVLAKTAMSGTLEPITASMTVSAAPEHTQQLKDFLTFGTELNLPLGSATGTISAPDGLGRHFTRAGLYLRPQQSPDDVHIRMMILDPDDHVIACLPMHRTSFTTGTKTNDTIPVGAQAVFVDDHEILTTTIRWVEGTQDLTTSFETEFTAVSVEDALPVTRFLASLQHPNRLLIAARRGPYDTATAQDIPQTPADHASGRSQLHRIVDALCTLQQHTRQELQVPTDLTAHDVDWNQVLQAAALASGRTLAGTLSEEGVISAAPGSFLSVDDHVEIRTPLSVRVPETTIHLGELVLRFRGSFRETTEIPEEGTLEIWNLDDFSCTASLEAPTRTSNSGG